MVPSLSTMVAVIPPDQNYAVYMLRKVEEVTLRGFKRFERPVAWVMFIGAIVTFGGVVTGLIATGDFRLLTLVASADLGYTGYSALREAYDSEEETG